MHISRKNIEGGEMKSCIQCGNTVVDKIDICKVCHLCAACHIYEDRNDHTLEELK